MITRNRRAIEQVLRGIVMTIKEKIQVIKQDEKAIYDYRKYHQDEDERIGLVQAEHLLYRKRKKLEKKLKK